MIRAGVRSCLKLERRFEVVGEAGDGVEVLDQARRLRPDVILMDLEMPRLNGFETIMQLRREAPEVRVLVLSRYPDSSYVAQAVRAGAHGYLAKTVPPGELISALHRVGRGETCFSSETARAFLEAQLGKGVEDKSGPRGPTAREREVVTLIADGLSNKQIGVRLCLGVRTVETHRERVMRKLGIRTVAGITRYAIVQGWISLK